MADQKISQLTSLTGANTASGDLVTIVDISDITMGVSGTNKKMTLAEFQASPVSAGTANGVTYLNGSKVATAGSSLVFDGTNLTVGGTAVFGKSTVINALSGTAAALGISDNATTTMYANNVSSGVSALWSSGAFAFGTGNGTFTERMRLDGSGNLGVGTSSPGVRLDVSGADGVRARVVATSGGTSGMVLSSAGNTAYTIKAGNADNSLRIDQDGTDRLTLASGGNLGIGTSSPQTRLHVEVTSAGEVARFQGPNSSQSRLSLHVPAGEVGSIKWDNGTTLTGTPNSVAIDNGGGAIAFQISSTERMRLDASGNLGIGTSSPGTKLHVVAASSQALFEGSVQGNVIIQRAGTLGMSLFSDGAGKLAFYDNTAGVTRMALDASGNFIVGTAALATTATAGFPWIPSCAGAPTGAPTAPYSNAAAMVVDTTNNRLYVRVGSTWRYATLT